VTVGVARVDTAGLAVAEAAFCLVVLDCNRLDDDVVLFLDIVDAGSWTTVISGDGSTRCRLKADS